MSPRSNETALSHKLLDSEAQYGKTPDSTPMNHIKQLQPFSPNSPAVKLKKFPQAPKRFKSSFIFFSMEKHRQLKEQAGCTQKTTHVAKMVAEAWKSLSSEDREKWEAMARNDMARYKAEKSRYCGPWKVPVGKRPLKDPSAPKRPMSAFLAYSNKRRGAVKRQNPQLSNAELSRALSVMWREAPDDVRQKYIKGEFAKRGVYKTAVAAWRTKDNEEKLAHHREREKAAQIAPLGVAHLPETCHTSGESRPSDSEVSSCCLIKEENTVWPKPLRLHSSFPNSCLTFENGQRRSTLSCPSLGYQTEGITSRMSPPWLPRTADHGLACFADPWNSLTPRALETIPAEFYQNGISLAGRVHASMALLHPFLPYYAPQLRSSYDGGQI